MIRCQLLSLSVVVNLKKAAIAEVKRWDRSEQILLCYINIDGIPTHINMTGF